MKNKRNIIILFAAIAAVILHTSCNSCQNKNATKGSAGYEIDSLEFHDEEVNKDNIAYKIPCPMELFIFIENNNIEYHSEILPNPDRCSQYIDNYSQSLNFGIYA